MKMRLQSLCTMGVAAIAACGGTAPANADPAYFDRGLRGPERKDLVARRDLCGAVKVPTLRNIARAAPYFRNGSCDNLRDVVAFLKTLHDGYN